MSLVDQLFSSVRLYEPKVDDESVDLGIAGRIASEIPRPPRLELQLKCTSDKIIKEKNIVFSLKRKNYDDLRLDDLIVPRLLVVLSVPRKDDDWLKHSETETTIGIAPTGRVYGAWRTREPGPRFQ